MRARLQEGITADITIFDPETVTDNTSFEKGTSTLPSKGIPFVIANGTVFVKGPRRRAIGLRDVTSMA